MTSPLEIALLDIIIQFIVEKKNQQLLFREVKQLGKITCWSVAACLSKFNVSFHQTTCTHKSTSRQGKARRLHFLWNSSNYITGLLSYLGYYPKLMYLLLCREIVLVFPSLILYWFRESSSFVLVIIKYCLVKPYFCITLLLVYINHCRIFSLSRPWSLLPVSLLKYMSEFSR